MTFLSSNVLVDIKVIPIPSSPIENRIFWGFSQDGKFTLNSITWVMRKSLIHPRLGMVTGRVFSGTRPVPNETGFKFNKLVWDGYEIYFLNPGRVQGGFGYCPIPPRPASSHPTPIIYKINFKIKLIKNFILLFLIYRCRISGATNSSKSNCC